MFLAVVHVNNGICTPLLSKKNVFTGIIYFPRNEHAKEHGHHLTIRINSQRILTDITYRPDSIYQFTDSLYQLTDSIYTQKDSI